VQREQGDLHRERGKEGEEQDLGRPVGQTVGRPGRQGAQIEREGVVLRVEERQREQPDEEERRAERGVQVELERGVHAPLVPPSGDDEVHRHEHDLEEHEEQDEIEAQEHTEERGLEHEHPHRVRLHTRRDRLRREQPDREQQRGQGDHEEADAVDAHDVADAERGDPLMVLDELVTTSAGVEAVQQVADEAERGRRGDVPGGLHELGSSLGQERDEHAAGERREDDERQEREADVAHQPARSARKTRSATAPTTTPRA
jgi:hypothetical protein